MSIERIGTAPTGASDWGELYNSHVRRLRGLAAAITFDPSTADEIVQDAFAGLIARGRDVELPVAYLQYLADDIRYSVTVIRSDDPLPEGIVADLSGVVTGRAWANNWQLVVAARADDGGPADRAVVTELLAAIRPQLEAWRAPMAVDVPICDTHVVDVGDSLVGIANRYGVDEASLRAANPDADVNLLLGATAQIPCSG